MACDNNCINGFDLLNLIDEHQPKYDIIDRSYGYVKYDRDDLLPYRVNDLYRNSPTHSAILNKKGIYAAGELVTPTNPNATKFSDALDNYNGLNVLLYKCALDYFNYGGFCIQVLWNKVTGLVSTALHQPFGDVRIALDDAHRDEIGVYLSPDFRFRHKYRPEFYPFFDDEEVMDVPCFIYKRKYTLGMRVYPLPDWWAGFRSIANEIEIINTKYYTLKQSFTPSGVLTLPAQMPAEARTQLAKKVKEEMTGAQNAGKILTVYADGKDFVSFTPFTGGGIEKSVAEYTTQSQLEISVAHSLSSPAIIGLPVQAGFNSEAALLATASVEFFEKVIQPVQKLILKTINEVFNAAGYDTEFKVEQSFKFNNVINNTAK